MTAQIKIWLFDWGDTLMLDDDSQGGKMCNWPHVEAVEGAHLTLAHLTKTAKVYVATGAADSEQQDIQNAFHRVGLDTYISGYFCQHNLGIGKNNADFYRKILEQLGCSLEQVAMVGDNWHSDCELAAAAGIKSYHLLMSSDATSPTRIDNPSIDNPSIETITSLTELINLNARS